MPGDTCASFTTLIILILAVKVALNPNTTNQEIKLHLENIYMPIKYFSTGKDFGLGQVESICTQQLQGSVIENLSERLENIVGKKENAGSQGLLLFQ